MGTENSNHTLYADASPYYQSILARWGRYLTPARVEAILKDHSLTLDDYEEDEGGVHERTDAADLLAWLGY